SDPVVLRSPTGWVVRYPVVAWSPGPHRVELPPIWRLGPDGRADSTTGGVATLSVASVLPDTLRRPEPKGLIGPLPLERRNPHPALSTAECLATVERARPDMPLRELRDLLEQLDRVAFASAHGTDVAALATMAHRLAREVAGGAP